MGTIVGQRVKSMSPVVRFLCNEGGPVAQLLYPHWMARDDASFMGDILANVEHQCVTNADDVRVVVTGGGFMEIRSGASTRNSYWRTEKGLDTALSHVEKAASILADAIKGSQRDYVIGIDVLVGEHGVGQFAVVITRNGGTSTIWKSYPVGDEARFLAGFGTPKGRGSPRIITTAIGSSLILVCHDAQAFNRRHFALVNKTSSSTPRKLAMDKMRSQMHLEQPTHAFSLIHNIGKLESLKTFSTSYKQICKDHNWKPTVVGAFGYDSCVCHQLRSLAKRAQYPSGVCRCVMNLELT